MASPKKKVEIDEGAQFRGRSWPLLRALGANFLLLGLLVGIPFVRGRQRAEAALAAFPPFAACFYGGTVTASPGLSIPAGDREAYATRVVRAPETWPTECLDELDAIALPEVTFLLPGPKQAEVEIRAAALSVRHEIEVLDAHRREAGDVPERPLLAITHLQAALSTMLLAIDDAHRGSREAISLEGVELLPAPSRIPLRVADGGSFTVRASVERIRFLTTDGSRASLVEDELAVGRVHELLVRRPRTARGTAMDAAHGYLAFVTSPGTCEDDAFHCAHRVSGLARLQEGVERPAAEVWIAGHPLGRIDRSLRVDGDRAWVVARLEDGTGELRRFALVWPESAAEEGDAAAEAEATPEVPSIVAESAVPLGAADALIAEEHAFFLRGSELHAVPLVAPEVEAPTLRATLSFAPSRLWSCGGWVVAASAERLAIVGPSGGAHDAELAARPPLEGPDGAAEPVQLACSARGVLVGVVTGARDAVLFDCADARCERHAIASAVDGVAAVQAGPGAVPGSPVGLDAPPLVATWTDGGPVLVGPLGAARTAIGACWEHGRGLCGPLRFAPGGPFPLLVGHDGTDAFVLSLRDDRWQPLPGLGAP